MKAKLFSMAVCTLISITMVSCGTSAKSPSKASKKSGTPYTISRLTSHNAHGSGDFSNGYTFQQLTNAGNLGDTNTYTWLLGCFDSKGKLQYCIELKDNSQIYAKDGYVQILTAGNGFASGYVKWTCVNTNGNIVYTYDISNSGSNTESEIICGGNDFILVRELATGFNAADSYTYKIIDKTGNVVLEYQDAETYPEFLGGGIFYLDSDNTGSGYANEYGNEMLFNAYTAQFIESTFTKEWNDYHTSGYEYGSVVSSGYLSMPDGTLIRLKDHIDYDSIDFENESYNRYLYKDLVENGYLIYYKNQTPYIFDFRNMMSYDCFSGLKGHSHKFLYHNDSIVAIVNGDDNNTYYMITDKNGGVIKELTLLNNSKGVFDSVGSVFYNDNLELSYYNDSDLMVFDYNFNTGEESIKNMTNKDYISIESDYYNGWAQASYFDYSSDGILEKTYYGNYINKDGNFLFDVNDMGYPVVYVKDSEILNY